MSKSDKPKRSAKSSQSTAVALKYNPERDYSPVVVASGHGEIAEKIIKIADENGVPCYRDDSAAALLTMLKVGDSIPPSLYQVVAAIYAEVLKASNELRKKKL